jgi:hypothetical protein
MLSPDKHIRKYFYDSLNSIVPVYDANSVQDTDELYIVMSNQTKAIETPNKCYDNWNCNITLEIIQRSLASGNKGSRLLINDLEQEVINAYESIQIDGFSLINKEYDSNSLVTQGVKQIIDRQIITINLVLKPVETAISV